jgi:2-C-methyl-D-erythritol 4-phosphate cytidylyltransferase
VTVWAIVVAAGGGVRFGGAKQFCPLGPGRVVDHAVAVAREAADGLVVVLPPGTAWTGAPVEAAVDGGPTRAASVRGGLAAVPGSTDIVVVHDAARPLARPELFRAVVAAVRAGADGAVPAVALADTLKQVDADRVTATVPRDGLVAVQTPQAFRARVLRRAHASGGEATDDAALVEAAGGTVRVVPGDPANLKVTTPSDLALASAWLAERGR